MGVPAEIIVDRECFRALDFDFNELEISRKHAQVERVMTLQFAGAFEASFRVIATPTNDGSLSQAMRTSFHFALGNE